MSDKNPRKLVKPRDRAKEKARRLSRNPVPRPPADDDELRAGAAEKAPFKHQAPPATDTITAPTPTLEQVLAENSVLREHNESLGENVDRLNRLLQEYKSDAPAYAAYAHAFSLLEHLVRAPHRLDRIEVRARPDLLANRGVPFEATLHILYPSGSNTFTARSGDPARALLEALARYYDETRHGVRIGRAPTDLGPIFRELDKRWTVEARFDATRP